MLLKPKTKKSRRKREHQKKPVKLQITKSNDLPQIERPKVEISGNTMCWTEKYKPKDIKSIIGQQVRDYYEEVSQLLSTTTIAGFAAGAKTTSQKRILLMDEVDGMAGNEDRGGMQELINLIKNSNIPIICMCNDRNHQKIRALVNYCFDLRFQKPRLEQIRGAMMSICFKEGINISPAALSEIINGTGCDIRQTLNHLSVWSAADKNVSLETAQRESKASKKDTVLGPWEVVKMVFSESEQKNMSLSDKSRLFFYDYSFGPLFVQENYLNITPNCKKEDVMKRVALAATL
ncbi:hypothetical protein NQ317_017135 [Molorchus minor]|uniref:ATPase AAA-type core domain-containing protein n=1 Tax=Molorchus minor TaxID=1323400 RepID=A0ABQ9JI01_9CUCU|nr:hypothetical protein NQ317_017135 [Molorchus minor]